MRWGEPKPFSRLVKVDSGLIGQCRGRCLIEKKEEKSGKFERVLRR